MLNDQRRAFSDEYVNLFLTASNSYIEISASSPKIKRLLREEVRQAMENE